MTVTLSQFAGAGAQFFDDNGNPLSGGLIYTYSAGTTTPAVTYTTNSDAAYHPNPIVLNAAGRVPNSGEIWLDLASSYKFVIKTSAGVLIATYDNIPASPQPPVVNDAESITYRVGYTVAASGIVAGKIYRITSVGTTNFTIIGATSNTVGTFFIATGAGSGTGTAELAVTLQSKLRDTISVKDYGAVGDGVTDDTAAINACRVAVGTTGTIFMPVGDYLYSGTVYPVATDFFWSNMGYVGGVDLMYQARASNMLITAQTPDTSPRTLADARYGISITVKGLGAQHVDGIRSNLFNYSTDGQGNTAFYGFAVSAGTSTFWSAGCHGETKHGGGTTIGTSSESESYEATGVMMGVCSNNTTGVGTTHPVTGNPPVDCTEAYGVAIVGTNTSGTGLGGWKYGIYVRADAMRASGITFFIDSTATVLSHFRTTTTSPASEADIYLQGNSNYGIILDGTYTNTAIRLSNNSSIAWEKTAGITTRYNIATTTFQFRAAGTERVGLNLAGTPSLSFNSTLIITIRNTGWTAMTGTSDKSTAYDTGTVTLAQLARRVKAIQDVLQSHHGLIGT